mmetsp:Transcript_79423/g.158584  ORF Transcript_79423/g.158584 Transcript_79423/m.158584 type:complete len:258 (-) Transcript_79423:950-1723(-)
MSIFVKAIILAALRSGSGVAMTENDRLEEYSRRGYHWPPAWVPPTKGWQALMERREKQLMSLPSSQARWDGWTVMVGSSSLVKNFTEKGFAVVRAPDSVNERLQTNLRAHKDTARFEDTPSRQIDVIKGRLRPKFIDQEDLNREILLELLPMFEEWSGVKLRPAIAYGLRIYQNESSLLMHGISRTMKNTLGLSHPCARACSPTLPCFSSSSFSFSVSRTSIVALCVLQWIRSRIMSFPPFCTWAMSTTTRRIRGRW